MANSIIEAQCSVCSHREIDNINMRLACGVTLAALAQEYGLSAMSLSRHRKNHLPKTIVQDQSFQDRETADRLLTRLEDIYKKAWALVESAETAKNYAAVAGLLREGRLTTELVAKLIGQLKAGNTINITYNQEFIEVRQLLITALKPYPAARQAVLRALGEGAQHGHAKIDKVRA